MNRGWLCGASAATLVCLLGAISPARAAAAADATKDDTVGELIVTAEKRSERLERVPDAITAFSAQQRDLVGIASVQDLTDFTPGLAYTTYDNRPYLRGVGRNTDNLAVESGVAVYVDGVYGGANGSTILQLDTLFTDQIEVLRGPQSTLYGRNADGGAINYVSKRPTKDFEAEVRTGYDSYDKAFLEGVVSGPITDSVRFRIGGNYTNQTDGYWKNLNGKAEGGGVAQGGNGNSYHVEGQLEGEVGNQLDWWVKLAGSDFHSTYHTETLLGPLDSREFPNPLFPNANYGTCALPGGAGGLGCAGGPDQIVSVLKGANTIAGNPSTLGTGTFDSGFKSSANEDHNWIFASSVTFHAPSFDVKYLAGYQSFDYNLTAPWTNNQGVTSGILGYTLQGPATATALCGALFNNAGCTQNLTVNSTHNEFTFDEYQKFYSNELNFTSTKAGPFQWLVGLYQFHEQYSQPINVISKDQSQLATPFQLDPLFAGALVAAAPNPTRSSYDEFTHLNEDSYAVFGQADYAFNDQFKLTAGLRYSDDSKQGYESFRLVLFDADSLVPGFPLGVNQFGANTPAFDATSCPVGNFKGAGACSINATTGAAQRTLKANWNAVTGVLNLAWTPAPDTLGYAKYSRGYKTGGFNSGLVTVNPETAPETIDAFEVGLKKTFGSQFQVNASAFYYLYHNDQQPLGQLDPASGVINNLIINIPSVHTSGVELESIWTPLTDLHLSLNYAYLKATIESVNGVCYQDAADPMALAPGVNTGGCAAGTGLQNLKGQTLPESPRNKVAFNGLYTWRFKPGNLVLSGTYIWKDDTYDSVFNRPYNLSPSYSQVNLRATWTDTTNRYSVIAYANNVFNTVGYDGSAGLAVTPAGPGQVIDRIASFTAPRVVGVELQYRFH
jgi:iron complex outermembrane receptor protein